MRGKRVALILVLATGGGIFLAGTWQSQSGREIQAQPQQMPVEDNRSAAPGEPIAPPRPESFSARGAPEQDTATTLVAALSRICEEASEREDCRQALEAIRDLDDEDAREALRQLDQQIERGWAHNRQALESLQGDMADLLTRTDLSAAERDQRIRELEDRIDAMTGKGLTASEARLLQLRLEAERSTH